MVGIIGIINNAIPKNANPIINNVLTENLEERRPNCDATAAVVKDIPANIIPICKGVGLKDLSIYIGKYAI